MRNGIDPDEFDADEIEESRIILSKYRFQDRLAFDNAAPVDVRLNCANWDEKYGCLCPVIDTPGHNRCCMADNKSCDYYETSVLPSLDKKKIKKYKKRVGKKRIKGEGGLRFCECGAALSKGKHYCPTCRAKSLKAAQKRAAAKNKRKNKE